MTMEGKCITGLVFFLLLGTVYLILTIKGLLEIHKKMRHWDGMQEKILVSIVLTMTVFILWILCIYRLPVLLVHQMSWNAVSSMYSAYAIWVGRAACVSLLVFMLYVLLVFHFPKENEINYVALVPLSLFNGLSNAMIVFTINETMNQNLKYSKVFLLYFSFALAYFLYTIKLLQGKMVVITCNLAYQKRLMLIDKILCTSYENVEQIGKDRIFTGLNNDCTAVSELPGVLVRLASDLLTILFCMFYLAVINRIALFASLIIIGISGALSVVTSRLSAKYWEENRSVQDKYFGQISDMVLAFKELLLNRNRRAEFRKDIIHTSSQSAELNKKASLKFLDFQICNMFMYNLILGAVVFAFPILIAHFDVNTLRQNLLIVFYMLTPFNSVIQLIPRITQMNVNGKRIDALAAELSREVYQGLPEKKENGVPEREQVHIAFQNIEYHYKDKEENSSHTVDSDFYLGPVNLEFNSGEIVFLTGGNGSGKSTIGKLATGLYLPDKGNILINGKPVKPQELNELFSSVYSDFKLLPKLYGIPYDKAEAARYLEMMKIQDKIQISDEGEFANLNLSTGQSKRLAYVVSLLEHKPMVILDEWAAEQDPQFRNYFYTYLLPELKKQGTGVILITHDDRYFDLADRVIKMERGRVLEIKKNKQQKKSRDGEKE